MNKTTMISACVLQMLSMSACAAGTVDDRAADGVEAERDPGVAKQALVRKTDDHDRDEAGRSCTVSVWDPDLRNAHLKTEVAASCTTQVDRLIVDTTLETWDEHREKALFLEFVAEDGEDRWHEIERDISEIAKIGYTDVAYCQYDDVSWYRAVGRLSVYWYDGTSSDAVAYSDWVQLPCSHRILP